MTFLGNVLPSISLLYWQQLIGFHFVSTFINLTNLSYKGLNSSKTYAQSAGDKNSTKSNESVRFDRQIEVWNVNLE